MIRPFITRMGDDHLQAADSYLQANFAQQILYVFTLFLSKCVVLLLYLRLTAGRKHAMLAYITIGLCVVWAVVSIIMVSISCNPYDWFTTGVEVCGDIVSRTQSSICSGWMLNIVSDMALARHRHL